MSEEKKCNLRTRANFLMSNLYARRIGENARTHQTRDNDTARIVFPRACVRACVCVCVCVGRIIQVAAAFAGAERKLLARWFAVNFSSTKRDRQNYRWSTTLKSTRLCVAKRVVNKNLRLYARKVRNFSQQRQQRFQKHIKCIYWPSFFPLNIARSHRPGARFLVSRCLQMNPFDAKP